MTKRNLLLFALCTMLICSCTLLASCNIDFGSVGSGQGTGGEGSGTGNGNGGEIVQDEYYIVDVQMVTPPTISDYGEGDVFDPTGMVLKVIWNDGWEQLVSDGKNCIFSPAGPITADTEAITAIYDDKTFTLPINVNRLTGIRVLTQPSRNLYVEGEEFSAIGLQIVTVLENGENGKEITDYKLSGNLESLTPEDKKVTVSYERAGQTYTCDIPIKVMSNSSLVVIEAEAGTVVGGEKVVKNSRLLQYASGNSFVRNLKEGATIAINIPSTKVTTASIRFVASSYEDDPNGGAFAIPLQINEVVKVSFNGVEIQIGDDEILPGGTDDERGNLSRYCHWYEIALDEVELKEGNNIFVITSKVNMNLQDDKNTPDVNEADLHSTLFDCLRVFYNDVDAIPEGEQNYAHEHTEETVAGKDATCSETGLTEGKKCSECGAVTVAQKVIGTTAHTPAEAIRENEVAAGCTTDGSYDSVVKCLVCTNEVSRETKTIPATGHSYTDNSDASCDNEGCDFVRDLNCEHTYESVVTKKPTPTEEGIKTYTCSKCFNSYTEAIEKLLETTYEMESGVVVDGDTVTSGSSLVKFMSGNGFVRNLKLGATITIKVVMDEATTGNIILVMSSHEDDNGALSYTRPVNVKEAITVTINGVNYVIGDDAILPGGPNYDFDGDGTVDNLTKHCHWYELKFEDIALNAGENTIVITSLVNAASKDLSELHSAIYDCVKVQYVGALHTHSASTEWEYNETHHWNDCTADDGQEYNKAEHIFNNACDTDCACGYVRTITHDFSGAYVTDDNQHWHECTTEGCDVTDTKVNHSFGNWAEVDGTSHQRSCECDKTETADHTFGEWNTTKDATETEQGSKERTCSACGYVETEVIPELEHTHSASAAWEYNETHHWNDCVANDGQEYNKAEHIFDNACDTDCACGYERAIEHSWNDGAITTKPTVDAEGVKTFTCSVCGATKTESVAKLTEVVIEAENGVVANGQKVTTGNIRKYASGTSFVANLKEGGTITITIPSTKDTTATLRFVMSSYEDALDESGNKLTSTMDLKINEYLTFTLNGQTITVGDDFILYGGEDYDINGDGAVDNFTRYCHFYELVIEDVQLNEGENTFVVTSLVDMSNDNADDLHSTTFDLLKVHYTDSSAIAPLTETVYQAERQMLSGITTTVKANGNSSGLFTYMEANGDTDPGFIKDFTAGSTLTFTIDVPEATKVKLSVWGSSTGTSNMTTAILINGMTVNGNAMTYNTGTCFPALSTANAQNMADFKEFVLGEFELQAGTNTLVITFNKTSACFIDRLVVTPVEE